MCPSFSSEHGDNLYHTYQFGGKSRGREMLKREQRITKGNAELGMLEGNRRSREYEREEGIECRLGRLVRDRVVGEGEQRRSHQ